MYMPFGIKTPLALFTRFITLLLQRIKNFFRYIEYVLVDTNHWEEHLATLRELLEGIRNTGLTIKPQKCELGATS